MVGISSKRESTEEECKTSTEEESVPQRSILDFFKSPGKPANKQQNLLGYFGKTSSSEAVGTVNGHGKTQADNEKKTEKKIGSRKQSTGAEKSEKKTTKRKRTDTDVTDSAVDTDIDCGEEKRVKRKKKNSKICKPLKLSNAQGKEDQGKQCNGDDREASKENFDTGWKYERNPNDKLQKEFDTIAEEFQLCDSEVKGKENKKIVNEASKDDSSEDEVVLLSDMDEVNSMSVVTCNGIHEGGTKVKMKEDRPRPHEEMKGEKEGEEEESKSSADKKTDSTLEWKKTLDMDKIKTPKGKEAKEDLEKKRKKRKMKLKKPEKPHTGNVKPLNLSDVCENLADVSILSDTSQTDGIESKGEGQETKSSEASAMVEVSFAEFLKSTEAETGNEDLTENTEHNVVSDEVDGKVKKGSKLKKKKRDNTNTAEENGKEDTRQKGKNKGEDNNADVEVSYMDYLKSLSSEENEEDESTKTEQVKEKKADLDACQDKKDIQTDEDEIPMPKQYPSITNFFKKVDKPNAILKTSSEKVTVKADVHTEPSVSPSTAVVSDTQKRSPLSGSKLDHEIQILGSEIVSVETPKTGLKKKVPKEKVDTPKSDAKEAFLESKSVKDGKKTRKPRKSLIHDMNKTCEDDAEKEIPKRGSHKKETRSKEENEEADDCICITDEAEKDGKENKMKQDFLQSGVSDAVLGKKTSQATFSFGKAGFKMKKGTPLVTRVRKSASGKESANESFAELPVSESTPLKHESKKTPGRRKKTQEIDVSLYEQDTDLDTSGITRRRSLRGQKSDTSSAVNAGKECQSQNKNKKLEEMTVAERRKLIRRKYSVALLDQAEKHGSPIRIRLTRYSKSSTSQDDTLSPGSQRKLAKKKAKLKKTSTAQKLLEKAKRGKSLKNQKSENEKKSKDEEEKEEVVPSPAKTGRRRSARLSDKHKSIEEVLIVDDESEDDCYTPAKTKTGKKGRGKAKTSTCTPKKEVKAPQKLAPIFMKKGKKDEPSTPIKKVLDPEAEKRRRAFLMSDVPEELRRQAASVITILDADFPPIPKINHVQQVNHTCEGRDMWKLPEVMLNYRKGLNEGGNTIQKGTWSSDLIMKSENSIEYTKIKTFTSHSKISESSIDLILSEIGRLNPIYPVKKMYSILREKRDDDIEEEMTEKNNKKASKTEEEENKESKPKTRPRRSLRLRPVIEVIDVIGSPEKVDSTEEAQTEKQDSVPPTLVFTEKYQPLNSSEVVGNTALLKKLKAWLVEWKHRVDKEARKARMLLMKKSKGKRPKEEEDSGDWWADDASDFDMSSDDSEDEDSLCNTVMLTGPTGIGKTATVYALAQELGFKVFEVNASSCRNGKRILAQLQEATQSHQVSKNSVGGANTPVKIDKKKETGVDQKKRLPTAFTNLFKQAESQSKKDAPSKKALKNEDGDSRKKKRKREEEEEVSKTSKKKKKDQEKPAKKSAELEKVSGEVDSGKSLSLSSTSLILFDEVDIVFEQDKAFWAAVQSFMSTTKIPIILTSNDSKLHTKFEGRFEHYAFKIPSMVTSTIYLQLVCLVENIRTDRQDIYNLISLYNGDIRKALNTLQLWVLSGGGCALNQIAIKNIEPKGETQNTAIKDFTEEISQSNIPSVRDTEVKKDDDDDDDFVTIKPITKRLKPLLFDEDSNSLPPQLPDTFLSQDADQSSKPDQSVDNAGDLPPVHLSCVNTMLGCGLGGDQDFLKRLTSMAQDKDLSWLPTAVEACIQYHNLKTNIIYNQHLDLLSLPKKTVESSFLTRTICTKREVQKPKRRRIKLSCDLYDSEGSGEEDCVKNEDVLKKESSVVAESVTLKETRKNVKGEIRSLASLYKFYDTLAITDVMRQVHKKSDLYGVSFGKEDFRGSMCIGLEDQPLKYRESLSSQELGASLCSDLELHSLIDLHNKQEGILQSVEEVEEETFSVPVTPCSVSSVRNESARCIISSKSDLKRVNDNIQSNVPLLLHCQPSVIAMDYTPTLRSMCKNEQIREAAKAKRRFHHYLDSIGLPLKTTTISALCSSFT